VPNNLMPFMAQVAVGRLDEISVFGDDYPTPDGSCVRDYIHVVDVADGHRLAVEHLADQTGLRVLNLGTGVGVSCSSSSPRSVRRAAPTSRNASLRAAQAMSRPHRRRRRPGRTRVGLAHHPRHHRHVR